MGPLPVESWRLAILGLDSTVIDLAVVAAGRNVIVCGIHDPLHHQALLASLRIGCSAYSTREEVLRGANIVLVGCDCEAPAAEREVLVIQGARGGGSQLLCQKEQRSWALAFLSWLEIPGERLSQGS